MSTKNKRAAGLAGLIASAAVIGGVLGTSSAASAATTTPAPPSTSAPAPGTAAPDLFSKAPVRTDEKSIGATEAAKVTAAAEAAVDGASVFRVETDADGEAYEAHMKKADGSVVTVKLDSNFTVTDTQDGFGDAPEGGPQGGPAPTGPAPTGTASNG